jgi:hypothetical protein
MTNKPMFLLLIAACTLTLNACDKKTRDAQADAVRDTNDAAAADIDSKADAVEKQGDDMGKAIEGEADAGADAMRKQADDVRASGERKADAIEDGKTGATTKTDTMTTTTQPKPR